jgi:hypothetical protein
MKLTLIVGGFLVAGVGLAAWLTLPMSRVERRTAPATVLPPELPTAGPPIDATRIQSGKLTVERMPDEITQKLDAHATQLDATMEVLQHKQARISGTCAPGSAIRVVGQDGSVVCQKLPRSVSVTALSGVPRRSGTATAQASVPGGVGRYQTEGQDDFLIIPVALPDGAIVTEFSYTFWDDSEEVDGGAYLYRSDDTMMARLATIEAQPEVRSVKTDNVDVPRVDNSAFGYMVYLQMSAKAGKELMPISASVTYRLP